MRILFIGDVVGKAGLDIIKKRLRQLIKEYKADFTIAQGENISERNGISRNEAEELHFAGADVITLGNHAFSNRDIFSYLDDCPYIVRPANYASSAPGHGYTVEKTVFGDILVISLSGQVNMTPCDSPFSKADKIIENNPADFVFIDFHAEATSEKIAFGHYIDGRATAVVGTHTHVQTADEKLLPKGTLYITDVGMTGSTDSVIGVKKESALKKFVTGIYVPLEQASGAPKINGVIIDTATKTIERIQTE